MYIYNFSDQITVTTPSSSTSAAKPSAQPGAAARTSVRWFFLRCPTPVSRASSSLALPPVVRFNFFTHFCESPASSFSTGMKGKYDDSANSRKGRKVQFSEEASPDVNLFSSKSGGKGDILIGKGGKMGSGAKSSFPKEQGKYELNTEQELPKNARCLMDCEVADILQGIQEQMSILSRDPTIKLPASFDKGLQYAKSGGQYTNSQAVREVLDSLKKYGVSDGEICVIANIFPDTSEEIFSLVPSLKSKRSKVTECLNDVLHELAKLKCPNDALRD